MPSLSVTTAWTCSISGKPYLDHPASCGWAAPGVRISIRRDDGSEAGIGEPGELWVSSAGLMTEYLGDAKATAEALQDGWLASGDVAIVDADGIFTIVDRKGTFTVTDDWLESRCGWSPFTGMSLRGRVVGTIVRGHTAMWEGQLANQAQGEALRFAGAL